MTEAPAKHERAALVLTGVGWAELAVPSVGASDEAELIHSSLVEIEATKRRLAAEFVGPLPSQRHRELKPMAERLYDALAEAKITTSQVAMHLDREWRDRLFIQLDDLLNAEDWHEDDQPVLGASFATFLRMILHQGPKRRPGLGVSQRGYLIAAWTHGADRLTLEFFPSDMIRWTLSCDIDGTRERAAGETPVGRLPVVLSPYRADRWFDGAPN